MRRNVIAGVAAAAAWVLVVLAPGSAGAVGAGPAASTFASAPIAGCDATTIAATGDLDGDGVPEVAVGMPSYPGGGGVDVRRTTGGGTVLTAASLGVWTPTASDRFGAAVVVTDLNGDRCADLVIGAPGRGGSGAVVIALGSPTGYRGVDTRVVAAPTRVAGAAFGSSLAVIDTVLSGGATGPVVVAGMPGYPVNGRAAAGALVAIEAPGGVPGAVDTATEDTAGMPGTAEAGDRFGSVLAPGRFADEVLVGVPLEDVGAVVDAGAVDFITLVRWGRWGGGAYSENSFQMPGVAEAGDHFGAAVISGGVTGPSAEPSITVGVPGEDVGRVRDVGSIVGFVPSLSLVELGTVVHQGGTWRGTAVPGTNETGDAFGSALAWQEVGLDINRLLVGVPREDIGATVDAGQLVAFDTGPEMSGTMSSLTESAPLFHGFVEAGDRFGATLASGRYAEHVGAFDHRTRVVVGIPGENVRAAADAGAVEVTDEGERAMVMTLSGGERAGLAYGSVPGFPQR